MATLPNNTRFPTANQVPTNSILDVFNKQVYLGNQYIYAANFTVGSSEGAIYSLACPSTSSISVFQNYASAVSLTASHNVTVSVYQGPTLSGAGTPVVPINCRPANSRAAVGVLSTGITANANGNLINFVSSQALIAGNTGLLTILDPGQMILITAIASAASTSTNIQVMWYEL